MKVITEEVLDEQIEISEKMLKSGCIYDIRSLKDYYLEEIDTLTVSKLRPMSDAPKDESIFLAKHEFNDELEETWSTGGGEFSTSQFSDLRIDTFEGWIPKPIYKLEKE